MSLMKVTSLGMIVFLLLGVVESGRGMTGPIQHQHQGWGAWDAFRNLTNFERGSESSHPAIVTLRNYFNRFGYLIPNETLTQKDLFDDTLEEAIRRYQTNFGLNVTGCLDQDTVSMLMTPRCGREDVMHAHIVHNNNRSLLRTTEHYSYFPGRPRWPSYKTDLTYSFDPDVSPPSGVSESELRNIFRRAFSRWAEVVPMTFTESEDYTVADLTVGFYSGDHGDGEPFDGVLGTLAHAFSPPDGRFHLDAAESWSVDAVDDYRSNAVDLESIATHEIGHLLGLGHSTVKDAIMFPSISPRHRKVLLMYDDVEAIQNLYGLNPSFNFSSLPTSQKDETSNSIPSPSPSHFTFLFSLPMFFFYCAVML